MKKVMLVLLLFISTTIFSQDEKYNFQNLIGTWRTKSGIGLDVVDSNTVFLVNGNQRKLAAASLSDAGRNPLSFTLSLKDSSKTTVLKGLLLFVNENMIQWQIFDRETKPVSFGNRSGSDMLFLKRIDQLYN